MAKKNSISYGTILKRSNCINSIFESAASTVRFDIVESRLEQFKTKGGNKSLLESSIRSYMQFLKCVENASVNFRQPLYIIQELNDIDTKMATDVLKSYTKEVLPYVEDLSGLSESLSRYELKQEQHDLILSEAAELIAADRIIANHNKISKRFNVEREARLVTNKGLRNVVESLCEMIDTYRMEPYMKLNVSIEETNYIFDKIGAKYNKSEIVGIITEYFLLRNDVTDKDISRFRKVLEENYYITEEDLSSVQYLCTDMVPERISIKNIINSFLLSKEKTVETLSNSVKMIDKCDNFDIINNLDRLLWLLWDIYRDELEQADRKLLTINYPHLFETITKVIVNRSLEDNSINRVEVLKLIDLINKVSNLIIIKNDDDYEYGSVASQYKIYLSNLIDNLKEISHIIYSESNLSAIDFVNNTNVPMVPLNEFKIFKFHNLVRAAFNLDKHLKLKSRKIYEKGRSNIRKAIGKVKDVLFGEGSNVLSYIGEDNKADICVAQYFIDESGIDDIINFLEEACKEFNNSLSIEGNSARCYYIINPGIAEVHIKESTMVELTEQELSEVFKADYVDLDVYVEEFASAQTYLEMIENYGNELNNVRNMVSRFNNYSELSMEQYEVAVEAMSLLNLETTDIQLFSDRYKGILEENHSINESSSGYSYMLEMNHIDHIVESYIQESEVPYDIQLEAYMILTAVLEANPPKLPKAANNKINKPTDKDKKAVDIKKDKSEDEEPKELSGKEKEELKKNPFKGININSLKLYLEGLKSKMKNMSQKEKEISRNLDNNFKRLVKGMHDALISDRREAIIKGSVIPSFSKCIKICIGLAGLGIATGGPVVPLLTAFGGFAMSKRLTKKERILLLDEIETELEVLEKEISLAESKNQMKKYRSLLKYKKDLQRQYQRIRYNVRVGKDILPNSAAGFRDAQ